MRHRVAGGTAWGALSIPVLVLVLAGCVPAEPEPGVTTPVAQPTSDSTPTAAPEPELDLQGTAEDNLAYFNMVNRDVVRSESKPDGRMFIDSLVAAGFPKSSMELTPDRTTIGAQADQIQFAVRMNGTCLLGQYGFDMYSGVAAPLLADGKCLIGTTRPIDW
ncbi:MAG: hypothetical protein KF727_00365 [Microbacteriaceae bacterium]|nr:hypothetical protein [Microbacteriaceae bacterium]